MNQAATPTKIEMVKLSAIDTTAAAKVRERVNAEVVQDYSEAMQAEEPHPFPPIRAFREGKTIWLADGLHRVEAAKVARLLAISAEVSPGTLEDAEAYACGANADNGLRRSQEDRRKAIALFLSVPARAALSDREVARSCRVSNHLVAKVRKSLDPGKFPTSQVTPPGKAQKSPPSDPVSAPPLPPQLEPTPTTTPQPPALAGHPEADSQGVGTPGPQDLLNETVELLEGAQAEISAKDAEIERLHRILDAEDILAAYRKEVMQVEAGARVLRSEVDGLMNRSHDYARKIKNWQLWSHRFTGKLKAALEAFKASGDGESLAKAVETSLNRAVKEAEPVNPLMAKKGA